MDGNKIAWLTDIHLNFLKPAARVQFYERVAEGDPDKILITGDIAEAKNVERADVRVTNALSYQTNILNSSG